MIILSKHVFGYGLVGIAMTALHASVAIVMIAFNIEVYVANVIAFTICLPTSLFLNKQFVFRSTRRITCKNYLIIYGLTIFIALCSIYIRDAVDWSVFKYHVIWIEHVITQFVFSVTAFLLFCQYLSR